MGCCLSSADEPTGSVTEAKAATGKVLKIATERLSQLQYLDATTKIPFLIIELTGEADGEGWVEISGKDEYNVYAQIHEWLMNNWDCEQMDPGDLSDEKKIPFCKAQYRWGGYKTEGEEGLSNMGKATMQIIDLMCGQLSWTLAVVTGGNQRKFGEDTGEIRETQIIFKAPHPMNLAVPHMLVEVRSAGYIEVCADLDSDSPNDGAGDPELRRAGFVGSAKTILDKFEEDLKKLFKVKPIKSMEDYCDRYYKVGEGVFKGTSGSVDSNFGLLVTDLCDKVVVGFPGWSLVAANGGSYGPNGEHQEQQLIFRRDENPLGDHQYLMTVLNSNGTVEVNGKEIKGVHEKFERFLRKNWGCSRMYQLREGPTMSKTFKWEAKPMPVAVTEVMTFFEKLGWEMQVCSQAAVKDSGTECREQQLFFRPGKTEVGTVEPHLFFEIYAGEGKTELYGDDETTQLLANQYIRVNSIADDSGREYVSDALKELDDLMVKTLRGKKVEDEIGIKYNVSVFLCRGTSENNVAQWVMRLCDFLVDRLGWSFIVCSQCNMGEYGQLRLNQLVFRYDGDKRDIPVSKNNAANNAEDYVEMDFPAYWTAEEVRTGALTQKVVQCSSKERDALQAMLDCTFKRVLTRDRQPDDDAPEDEEMPYCLDLVTAFRSEHAPLYKRFVDGRGGEKAAPDSPFQVKTASIKTMVTRRLAKGDAYLFHGTNPSSAMSILKTGFVLDHAGSATGTMYGTGVYTAECASKSDEYAQDDGGNTYPSLNALLVCRCYVGRPHVVDSAGDRCREARDQGFDCVCGDRETKAGTYREFVFFDEAKVYPEYVVIYRRQYASSKAPRALQGLATTGTTGRFWQMKLERGRGQGWRNVPAEINKQLIKADRTNNTEVACDYQGTTYLFNLADTKATNTENGLIFPLRRPMVS